MTSQTEVPQTLVGPLLQSFFMEHLCNHKRLSPQTVKSYRDTFRLLIQYLQAKMAKKPSALSIADLDAPVILSFLESLEQQRHNQAQSRNVRLTAIRSFFRLVALRDPASVGVATRVLAIPLKRTDQHLVGYLTRPEVDAILVHDFDTLKIWFIRHAESEANVQRIYANGDCSFSLTANGLQQAKAIACRFSSVDVRAIYTSPLLRATQTAEEVCKIKKMEMQIAPELSEYSMGIYEGTSSWPDALGAICDAESKKRWFEHNDFDAKSPGGESLNDMKHRFLPFVKKAIENCTSESGTLVMITHGGILGAMLPFAFENLDF